ncbi:MAG: hypothetical protein NC218_07185 [Acetobacter sp.]|nr:hypothetical protein [Acetobacter sp.]
MVGDIIKVKGIDLLVLDERDGNPFVIALNTGIETEFDDDSNNYDGSTLEAVTNDWLEQSGLPTIERELDLMTLDGCKDYGKKMVAAAPLTLREYQDYSDIIVPHIENWFWLVTGWTTRSRYYGTANRVCGVGNNGGANYNAYGYSIGLAPAFVLDKSKLGYISKFSPVDLDKIPTEILVAELNRRFNENNN